MTDSTDAELINLVIDALPPTTDELRATRSALSTELRYHLSSVSDEHDDADCPVNDTVQQMTATLVEMLDWADQMRAESSRVESGGVGRFFADEIERRIAATLGIH